MNKRAIILIITLILVILGAFWFFFFQGETSGSEKTQNGRGFLGIFPNRDGGGDNLPIINDGEGEEGEDIPDIERPVPDFRQISFKPISGYGVFSNGSTTIRFLEKETGHIFEANTDNLEINRLSNTTIPKIREVLWSSEEDSLLMRYLDDDDEIQTFVVDLEKEEGDEFFSIESEPFSTNITSVDVFDDSFFGVIDTEGGSEWALFNNNGNKDSLVISPLKEWLVKYFSSETVALQTKSSVSATGNLYYLNLNSIGLTEILSNLSGLSSLPSPSGDFVLYSSNNNGLETRILSLEDNSSILLDIKTLGEKCVWESEEDFVFCAVPKSLSSNLPDSWYQGKILFNDSFWRIEVSSGEVEGVFDPQAEGSTVDAESLQISENNNFLFFINRRDGTFWSLNLESF